MSAANQAQIDSAIDSIDRIVNTTSFNGQRLLDGAQSIRTSSDSTANTDVSDIRIYSRRASSTSDTLALSVTSVAKVVSAAITVSPAFVSAATFTVTGKLGTATVTVGNGDTAATIRDRIIAAAKKAGKIPGAYCHNAERALVLAKRGMRFIAVASDMMFLRAGAAAQMKALKGGS